MPAAERAEKCRFLSLVTFTFKLVRARDQTHLCEFGGNPFRVFRDISYTNPQTDGAKNQKQNLPQFTVCGK